MIQNRMGMRGHVIAEKFNERGLLVARYETHNLITDTGDIYYATRAGQKLGATVAITAITAANPAVVTTSAAHGLSVGDVVVIAGVTPAYYNGSWAVTAVGSATTFSINVGTASTVGTAFGTAQGLNSALAVGMKLGTGSTAVAKNGAGAALVTYLSGSNLGFDATYPTFTDTAGSGDAVLYQTTWGAGVATTASAITEAVIFNDFNANATSTAANTISRVLLSGIGSKGASDTLKIQWTHTLDGQ